MKQKPSGASYINLFTGTLSQVGMNTWAMNVSEPSDPQVKFLGEWE